MYFCLGLLWPALYSFFMIYPEIDLETWKIKHNLIEECVPCSKCNNTFETTVPILIKGYAGLETPLHECGRKAQSAVFKPIKQTEINFWINSKAQ